MAVSDIFSGLPADAELSFPTTELLYEALDCDAEWREQATAVDEAYRRWQAAPVAERRRHVAGYVAALDQEEAAATAYAVVARELRASLRHVR